MTEKTKRTCKYRHTFYKSTDYLICLTCEKLKEFSGFLTLLSNPARNALLHYGIDTIEKLVIYAEKVILKLHAIRKASLPIFKKDLENKGLKLYFVYIYGVDLRDCV